MNDRTELPLLNATFPTFGRAFEQAARWTGLPSSEIYNAFKIEEDVVVTSHPLFFNNMSILVCYNPNTGELVFQHDFREEAYFEMRMSPHGPDKYSADVNELVNTSEPDESRLLNKVNKAIDFSKAYTFDEMLFLLAGLFEITVDHMSQIFHRYHGLDLSKGIQFKIDDHDPHYDGPPKIKARDLLSLDIRSNEIVEGGSKIGFMATLKVRKDPTNNKVRLVFMI